ncbi:conjugal transfer protein TraJ [Klebsiella aerogenes]
MDRIENTTTSQLEFFRELQITVNLSSHPACIRLRDGTFTHFNISFAITFLKSVSFEEWFKSIDVSSAIKLSALDTEIYSDEDVLLMEENLDINGSHWDFIIERMSYKGIEFTIWKFCKLQRGDFLTSLQHRKCAPKVSEFKKSIEMLSEVKTETLALYCFGASHQVISEILSIQKSTAKRRINRIYSELPVKSRKELYYLVFASGLAFQLFKVIDEIIKRRVNGLLNK